MAIIAENSVSSCFGRVVAGDAKLPRRYEHHHLRPIVSIRYSTERSLAQASPAAAPWIALRSSGRLLLEWTTEYRISTPQTLEGTARDLRSFHDHIRAGANQLRKRRNDDVRLPDALPPQQGLRGR